MSGHAVRLEFMTKFKGLSVSSRRKSGLIVTSYVSQVLAAIGLGYWFLQQPQTVGTSFGIALVMFYIGTRLRGFNNIVHECSHFTFTERREDNVVIGSICASLVMGCFRDYRSEHMTHHLHLGDYEKDLDLQGIRDFRLEDPLTPKTILRHVLTPLLGLHFPQYFSVNMSDKDGLQYRALKIGLIVAATIFLVIDPLAAVLLVWMPFVWVYSAINYWTDCFDHGGLVGAEDELASSRNLPVPKHLSMILFPRNDYFHLVHHLFPQVPAPHFDACHEELLKHPDYRKRAEGSRARGAAGSGNMVRVMGDRTRAA